MKCNYDQFLELFPCIVCVNDGYVTGTAYPKPRHTVSIPNGYYLCFSRYKGGYKGGNCWDDTQSEYYASDDKISYSELDDTLEEHFPNISFKQYKELSKLFLDPFYEVESEYYGNTSEYEYEFFPLRELFDKLCLYGLIKETD